MNIWRPRQTIRVIAIGLNWRDGKLLATETMDDSGNIKGVRPLGGGVEFGEAWQEALVREFQEERHIEITIISKPWVMESIYTHEGETGHEIVFAANVTFPEGAFVGHEAIDFSEDSGLKCKARWYDLNDLDVGGPELYPEGLKAQLLKK